jgi:hypothetical protein
MLSNIPKGRKTLMCLKWKIRVVAKLHPGMSYSAEG